MIKDADEDEVFIGRDFGRTSRDYSEDVAKTIDNEVKAIIDDAYTQAKSILEEHIDILHKCAKLLMEKERIDRAEFEALFEKDGEEVSLDKQNVVSEEVDVEPGEF